MKKQNENDIISKDIQNLEYKSKDESFLNIVSAIFIGFAIFIAYYNISHIISLKNNRSVPLVGCPRSFENDKPVLLTPVTKMGKLQFDNYIKAFIIEYLRSVFPEHQDDFDAGIDYVIKRSDPLISKVFKAKKLQADAIKRNISQGRYIKFRILDEDDIKIRKEEETNSWVIRIPGFMHIKNGVIASKSTPTITMAVKIVPATLEDPEGLQVVYFDATDILDPVSGKRFKLLDFLAYYLDELEKDKK